MARGSSTAASFGQFPRGCQSYFGQDFKLLGLFSCGYCFALNVFSRSGIQSYGRNEYPTANNSRQVASSASGLVIAGCKFAGHFRTAYKLPTNSHFTEVDILGMDLVRSHEVSLWTAARIGEPNCILVGNLERLWKSLRCSARFVNEKGTGGQS